MKYMCDLSEVVRTHNRQHVLKSLHAFLLVRIRQSDHDNTARTKDHNNNLVPFLNTTDE